MDRKEFLKKVRAPKHMYNIDGIGRDDERFCMVKEGEKWNVYYSERGCKTTDKYFDSESEALAYIYEELSDSKPSSLKNVIRHFIKRYFNN